MKRNLLLAILFISAIIVRSQDVCPSVGDCCTPSSVFAHVGCTNQCIEDCVCRGPVASIFGSQRCCTEQWGNFGQWQCIQATEFCLKNGLLNPSCGAGCPTQCPSAATTAPATSAPATSAPATTGIPTTGPATTAQATTGKIYIYSYE
jgi:hypothetical protein